MLDIHHAEARIQCHSPSCLAPFQGHREDLLPICHSKEHDGLCLKRLRPAAFDAAIAVGHVGLADFVETSVALD